MTNQTNPAAVAALRVAILSFGDSHPDAVRRFARGQRIISQGAVSDDCFLIKEGTIGILVRQSPSGVETQVALRFEGDLIGETAFLQRNAPRTASVEVVSASATLIRLSRADIFSLLREDPALHNVITLLWELAAYRRDETLQVLQGHVAVENHVMSVLLADIHNFSALGEAAWEEQSSSFLFDFVEQAHETATRYQAAFEDQGDGFRILFLQPDHVRRALSCATTIRDAFLHLRKLWVRRNDAFGDIGLGVGICTDCVSIRKREGSPQPEGRVLSHAINIAAAMSKYRSVPSDVDIYIDENTFSMSEPTTLQITGPHQKWLEKLGRFYPLYSVHTITSAIAGGEVRIGKEGVATNLSTATSQRTDDQSSISILFLASDPSDASRLRLAEEAREIQEKLQLSKYRERFSFHQRWAVRPEDLSQALLDIEPQIVHVSGHGTSIGELCFEDKTGTMHPISSQSLAALFREFSKTVRCVVLNACFSKVQANAIVSHVDFVIGMDNAISDAAAIAFAVGLYQAIGAGKAIDEAYRLGCVQISLQGAGGDENRIPVLKKRTGGRA